MSEPRYYAPTGGHPSQRELTTDRAVFTEAYAVIPRGTLSDITASRLPHWDDTRLWVIARPLSGFAETFSWYVVEVAAGGGSDRPDDDWLAGWLAVKASTRAQEDVVRTACRVVTGSPADYLTLRDAQGVVGVVRAATVGAWGAVSCLAVAPRARRRGVASTLTEAALERVRARGASWAFVQVEQTNDPARSLYEGLGFERVAAYHYRERRLATA